MQATGYIILSLSGEKIKLLVRPLKTGRALRLRLTGGDGVHLEDEEAYLGGAR